MSAAVALRRHSDQQGPLAPPTKQGELALDDLARMLVCLVHQGGDARQDLVDGSTGQPLAALVEEVLRSLVWQHDPALGIGTDARRH